MRKVRAFEKRYTKAELPIPGSKEWRSKKEAEAQKEKVRLLSLVHRHLKVEDTLPQRILDMYIFPGPYRQVTCFTRGLAMESHEAKNEKDLMRFAMLVSAVAIPEIHRGQEVIPQRLRDRMGDLVRRVKLGGTYYLPYTVDVAMYSTADATKIVSYRPDKTTYFGLVKNRKDGKRMLLLLGAEAIQESFND